MRDYLPLTTTCANHCSWPMRKSHLVLKSSHVLSSLLFFHFGDGPNLQLHIVKSPFSHLHFYMANLTSLHYFTGCPQKIHWLPNFLKSFFAQTLFFRAVFFWGERWACISGLPSYLLAYILPNLHTHLLRLPIHLPTYLPRCRPLSSPTYNLGYQLMTKFASLQIYKIKGFKSYKLIITNYNLTNCKFVCLQLQKFASLQACKFTKLKNLEIAN